MEKPLKKSILSILFMILVCLGGGVAFASDPYMDSDFKAYEDAYGRAMKACWKYSSAAQTTGCEKKVREQFKGDTRARGLDAYCAQQYGGLSLEELHTVVDELTVLRDGAYNYRVRIEKRPHGVLGQSVINAELKYIQNRINELELAAYCQGQKNQLQQLGLSDSHLPPVCQKYYRQKAAAERLQNSQN